MTGPGGLPAGSPGRGGRLLLAMAVLVVLGMSPIVGHHVAGGIDRLAVGTDHVGALCLIALHTLLQPVHGLFHLLLAAGVAYAAWDRVRASRLLARTLASVDWKPPARGTRIEAAARDAGVPLSRVRVARGLPVPAFTAGWLWPRVYLARELGDLLTAEELAAVVAHEGAHAARRDPLRLSLLRFLAHTLFWIPMLRQLSEDCADEAEIRADDAARRGRPLALASAILTVAEWGPSRCRQVGVGLHHPDLLDRRVRRLAGNVDAPRTHVTARSAAGAAAMLLLVWTTGAAVAHPLPGGHAHRSHCEHDGASAWTHLLCAWTPPATATAICPHD